MSVEYAGKYFEVLVTYGSSGAKYFVIRSKLNKRNKIMISSMDEVTDVINAIATIISHGERDGHSD